MGEERARGGRPPREVIPPEADEVLPYLYLGNLWAARDETVIKAKGITHILNLTRHSVPQEVRVALNAVSYNAYLAATRDQNIHNERGRRTRIANSHHLLQFWAFTEFVVLPTIF